MARKMNRAPIANAFGALGYCSVVLQWLWAFLITCYPLIMNPPDWVMPQEPQEPQPEPLTFELPDIVTAILVTIIFITVVGFTLYVIATLPKKVGKTGQAAMQKASSAVIPIVTKHHPMSEQKRRKLTIKTIAVLKALVVIIPLLAIYLVPGMTPLSQEVSLTIGLAGVAASTICFGLQYSIARLVSVQLAKLW